MTTEALDGIQLILGIDHLTYAPGEPIELRLRVVNRLDAPRSLTFSTGQRVDGVLLNEGGIEVARWSHDQMFTQALGEEVLPVGNGGLEWTLELIAPSEPGRYELKGLIPTLEGTLEATLPLEVRGESGDRS
jgi:hypothetical protein